ncbi:flagellar basal body-associated protein FliL [Halomonas sp. FeN2]|uniref:Flagellar protein FliL n=1 Tax=Vreelandella neptunia TaxID=115551 RepID=A0ABZ0YLG8_9GAMM|nr:MULTISPECIES: flagellar basal body-associated protein FliL [Halomonas]TDV89872.1 flagellar FliL protein [Halomonas alkaliantarctica]MBF58999.1 flagellar basal body-associated protein FliL [Halomonas sp.]MDN3562438.1 flagellar basal body-associated protein FliL [Halomonas neptunia]UBR48108.1 flagellar basal body-associated protein FliL [Halomonas sp. FeN2]WQH12974.1 flagellar basal body-associated protein FliL [Halomonas neptunia]|tara:strand:+ start:1909 stop:2385 length:477 start_codon:yes stop_codon:yes gene_type:complete
MAEKSGGSKKLLWIMIILVLLSSAGAAAAIYMVMDQRDDGSEDAEMQQAMERQTPIFMQIEPFTVNLADDSYGSRLLYTGVTLRVGNEESKAILEEHMPQVRSRLLMLLSGKQADELTSSEGKQQLAQAIVDRLNVPLTENQPPLDLREVLFTEFIVQ